jgi:hypothetical protein
MIALIVVLALVLAGVMLRQFGVLPGGSKGDGGPATPAQNSGPAGTVTPAAGNAQASPAATAMPWERPDAVGPIARDPMHMDLARQLATQASTTPGVTPQGTEFSVTGIVYSTEQPSSAIIDGRILREGDTIYGATITRINENSVEFSMGDKRWTVRAGERTATQE